MFFGYKDFRVSGFGLEDVETKGLGSCGAGAWESVQPSALKRIQQPLIFSVSEPPLALNPKP